MYCYKLKYKLGYKAFEDLRKEFGETNLGQGGLQLPHVVPHCAGGDASPDVDGVRQVLHRGNNIDPD